jgi:hypothetical protein
MDADRFDAITRLAATSPRRRILAGMVGGVATSLGLVFHMRGVAAAPSYDDRGQTCSAALPCNAPCRSCDIELGQIEGRCVYACPNATHVCAANGQGNCDARISVDKGCCVCRDPANCPYPV